jgi:PAS domain S-box-containing protein
MSDNEDLITYWNPAAERIFGYRTDEVIGKRLHDLISHPKYRQPDHHDLKHFHETGESAIVGTIHELTMLRKGGVEFPGELSVSKAQLKGRWHAIGIVRDITERKKAEESIHKIENRNARLLEAIPDMIFIISQAGEYLEFRVPDTSDLLIPRDQIIGKTVRDTGFDEKTADKIMEHVKQTLETKKIQLFEYKLAMPSGVRDFEARMIALGENEVLGIVRDITEQKEKELEVQKLAAIVRHSSEMTALVILDGTIDFMNEAGARMLDAEPEQVVGRNIRDFFTEHQKKKLETEVLATLGKEGYWEGEMQYLTTSGRVVDAHAITFVITDLETGEPRYLANVSMDITEHKKAREALKASEEQFRSLAENSSDLIVIGDENWTTQYASPSIERILGYKPEEVVGKEGLIYYDPEYIPLIKEAMEKSGGTAIREAMELQFERKDGKTAFIEITGSPIIREGKITGVQVIGRDVTLRKDAEKQRNLLSAIVQYSNDAIIGLDLQGQIISWNEGARRMFGYTKDEIVGKEMSILVPPDRQNELDSEIERFSRGEATETYETVRVTKFEERIDVAVNASPILDEKGEVTGASVIVRDISKEKKMSRTMLGYITEAAMRLKNPVEIIHDNLEQTLESLETGEIDLGDARMQITIQIKNAEQVLFNLRELDQAIVGTFEDLPDRYREFLTR